MPYQTSLLSSALTSLYDICLLPLDTDVGLTDLAQVHGINILQTLFADASLSATLIGHTGQVTIMVVRLFGSPSWAIRNAATRLYSEYTFSLTKSKCIYKNVI